MRLHELINEHNDERNTEPSAELDIDHRFGLPSLGSLPVHSRRLARFLAICSQNAYSPPNVLSTVYAGTQSPWIFQPDNFVSADSMQAFILYSVRPIIIISFRGTSFKPVGANFNAIDDSLGDIVRDAQAMSFTSWGGTDLNVKVGLGWYKGWQALRPGIMSALGKILPQFPNAVSVIFTGHSMGAALATLAFYDLVQFYGSDPSISFANYTFACPLVGNQEFADSYKALLSTPNRRSYSYIDPNDWVIEAANWFLTNPWKLAGYQIYAPVVNSEVLQPGNGHSIANYIALLRTPAGQVIGSSRSKTKIVARSAQPHQLGGSSDSLLVIRLITSDAYQSDTNLPIYFSYNVNPDGSGGTTIKLSADSAEAFGRGVLVTFSDTGHTWKTSELARCKLIIDADDSSPPQSSWNVQGIELTLNGWPLVTLTNQLALLDSNNPEFLFSGLEPELLTIGINWQSQEQYNAHGSSPTIAMAPSGAIVEVHKGEYKDNQLYYCVGKVDNELSVRWDQTSTVLGQNGEQPSISINADGWIVLVHKGKGDDNQLYYRVGQISETEPYTITWSSKSSVYDSSGFTPSVSIFQKDIVEVHKGAHDNTMYYRRGTLNTSNFTVSWDASSHSYDTSGIAPSVALTAGGRVLEVHKGGSSDALYYRMGKLTDKLLISWDKSSHQYDSSGFDPAIAVDIYGRVIEVHRGANSSPLYYRTGLIAGDSLKVDFSASSVAFTSDGWEPAIALNGQFKILTVFMHNISGAAGLDCKAGTWNIDPYNIT